MSQGAQPDQPDDAVDFDADAWFTERGLDNRRLRFGGRVYRFNLLRSAEDLKQANVLVNGDRDTESAKLIDVLAFFLHDPADEEPLRAGWRLPAGNVDEFALTVYEKLFQEFDLGESSASSRDSTDETGGTPAPTTSAPDSAPASA